MKKLFYSGGRIKCDSNHPAIKRRLARFARTHNYELHNWENNNIGEGGLVVVSQSADLTSWKRLRDKNIKIIFEANDAYVLDQSKSLKNRLRGTFKFLTGRHRYLEFNFKNTVKELCNSVDAVVVGHHMVYELLKPLMPNIHLIPDYSVDLALKRKEKFDLSDNGEIHIFWEGLGSSYLPFEDINRIFKPLKQYKFIFHFVTDLSFHAIADKYDKKYVFEVAKEKAPDMYQAFRFYQWSEFAYNNIGILCDFAIIPLPFDNSMNYYKPENKLIQMWRMGLPTITSAIPSYKRAFESAGLSEYCFNDEEWRLKITNFASNLEVRRRNSQLGISFVEKYYSNEVIDALWQNAIDSVQQGKVV